MAEAHVEEVSLVIPIEYHRRALMIANERVTEGETAAHARWSHIRRTQPSGPTHEHSRFTSLQSALLRYLPSRLRIMEANP